MGQLDYRTVLDFEARWQYRTTGKDEAILQILDVTPTHYAQALNAALDLPEALVYRPALVNALRRARAARRRAREERNAS